MIVSFLLLGRRQKINCWTLADSNWVFTIISRFQVAQPAVNQIGHDDQIQTFVDVRIWLQIFLSQPEKRRRRLQPVLLQMYECSRQLNQSLVKIPIETMPVRQPQIFQDIVGFIKFLLVKKRKVTGITRIQTFDCKLPRQFQHSLVLAFVLVHAASLSSKPAAESSNLRD